MGLIPKLKSKKLFPLVPVGAYWQTQLSATPASPGFYAGYEGGGSALLILSGGTQPCACAELGCSCGPVPKPGEERHPDQRDEPVLRPARMPRADREGKLVTGPDSDAADSP